VALLRSRLREAESAGLTEPLFLALLQYPLLLEPAWLMEESGELAAFREWIAEKGFSLRLETEETELEQLHRLAFEDRNGHRTRLAVDFFKSKMYRNTWQIRETIREKAAGLDFIVARKEISQPADGLFDLERVLFEEARRGLNIQRYKGLGEMNPEQLWITTMNPENRVLLQVSIDDAEEASEAFEELMGDRVEARREFIERNALNVQDLDI
jgi:DNA gyrase subunit B